MFKISYEVVAMLCGLNAAVADAHPGQLDAVLLRAPTAQEVGTADFAGNKISETSRVAVYRGERAEELVKQYVADADAFPCILPVDPLQERLRKLEESIEALGQ